MSNNFQFQWFVKVDNRTHGFQSTNYPHNLHRDTLTFCDRFCVTADASIQCTNTIIDHCLKIGKLHEQYENNPYSDLLLPHGEEAPSEDDFVLLSSTSQHTIAGDSHYKSYRNSPEYYGAIGSLQQTLLFHAGLFLWTGTISYPSHIPAIILITILPTSSGIKDHHKVLEWHCGGLNLGKLLIPFLGRGSYGCIEPQSWMVKTGWIDRFILVQPYCNSTEPTA